MNDIIKSLYNRKSVRVFEEREISSKDKRLILESALQAPSAGNMTLYTILDVTEQKLKDTLSVTCDNQPFIAKAPLVLVFCADFHRWYEFFCRHCDEVRRPSLGDLQLACVDAVIAAHNCVVCAESLGIGSCYIGDISENFERHRELFNLPNHVVPVCMLVFGYPTQQQIDRKKPVRAGLDFVVHENQYHRLDEAQLRSMLVKNCSEENYDRWIKAFCERKYNSDFSREMTRSVRAYLEQYK